MFCTYDPYLRTLQLSDLKEEMWDSRAEAKSDIRDRMAQLSVKGSVRTFVRTH